MASFQEFLQQTQATTPEASQPTGFDDFLRSQAPAPTPGPLDGKYAEEVDYDFNKSESVDDSERGGILRSLFAPAIGLGKDIAQWTGLDKRKEVESIQAQTRKKSAETLLRRGVINNADEYTQDNLQNVITRIQNSNLDDRQKAVALRSLDESLSPQLPPARTAEQAIGDVIGTVLMVAPVGHIFKAVRGASLLATAGRGAITGAAIGATSGMSENEDLKGILKSAAIGGAIGAPFEVGAGLLGRGIKAGASKLKESNFVQNFQAPRFLTSIGTRLQKDFGEQGKEIYDRIVLADNNTLQKAGGRISQQIDSGLLDLDDNAARRLTLALEGHIAPDEQIRPAFEAFDKLRKEIAEEAIDKGVKVRVSGKKFSFEGLTEQLDSGDISKMDVKASTLGKKGAKEIPFKARENFFRHYTPSAEDLKTGPIRQSALENSVANGTFKSMDEAQKVLDSYIDIVERGGRKNDYWAEWLVKTGQAEDIAEARGKTLRFFKNSRLGRSGSLEKAREVDFPFYDPDSRRVIPAYIMEATTRLEEIDQFGLKFEKIDSLMGEFMEEAQKNLGAKTGADQAKTLRSLINKVRGAIETTPERERVNIFLRSLQIPKLAFAQVLNVGQNLNTLLASDAKSVLQTLPYVFSKESYRRAIQTGATLESVMQESQRFLSGSKLGEKVLRYTGFSKVEKFNRMVAANVGINYARNTAQKLIKNPESQILRLRLQELGINPDSALAKGGLVESELLRAGQRLAEITQFRSRPIDLPAFTQSPEGKTIFQFKSFAYQQAKFLKNRFVSEVRTGNYGGLARDLIIIATIFPMAGEVIGDVRSLITGTKRPTDAFDRYLENLTLVGGMGILSDAITSAGWGRLAEWVIGPTGGTVVEGTERLVEAVKNGEFDGGDAKFLLNQTGFGRALGNYLYPSDRAGRETFLETLQDEL